MDVDTLTRTAGCAVKSGRLRVGGIVRTVAAGGPSTVSKASIPSRFETILNTGPREKDGFWNRTNRFNDPDNERPGPGTYRKSRSLKKNTPSVSKLGLGSFASTTRIRSEELPPILIGPGPGGYTLPTKIGEVGHKPHPSTVFCSGVPQQRRQQPNSVPGPGKYFIAGLTVNDSSHPNAVFRVKQSQSLLYDPPKPGPGDYEPLTTLGSSRVPSIANVFKSTTSRSEMGGLPAKNNGLTKPPPPAFASQDDVQGTFGDVLKHLKPEDLEIEHGGRSYSKKEAAAKSSSSFVVNSRDRFGRPTVRYVAEDDGNPGPGKYDIDKPKTKMLISSSWALSGNLRFREPKVLKPPGPAFYNPVIPQTKVDHHVKRIDEQR